MVETEPETKVLPAGGARPAPSAGGAEAPLRRRVGRYELIQRIAAGGMATVFLARATGSAGFEKLVAIKVIHPHLADDPDLVEMFLDEGRIASRIRSPHVVEILDLGEDRGDYYMVMELVEGVTLSSLLRELRPGGERLPLPAMLRILADTCEGLRAAHELRDPQGALYGLIHRDVSPQNLMVDLDGWVKVVDFGIMKAKGRRSDTRTGQIRGKLAYMSPEQAQSRPLTPASDLFALGVVLWEMCTGARLFAGESEAETLARVLRCERPPLAAVRPDLPAEVEALLARTLTQEPGDRFPSAEAMLTELRRLLRLFAGDEEPRALLARIVRERFGAQASYRQAAAARGQAEGAATRAASATETATATAAELDAAATATAAERDAATRPELGAATRSSAVQATAATTSPGAAEGAATQRVTGASSTLMAVFAGESLATATRPPPRDTDAGEVTTDPGARRGESLERPTPRAAMSRRARAWGVWLGLPLVGATAAALALSGSSPLRGEPARPPPRALAETITREGATAMIPAETTPEAGSEAPAVAPAESTVRWTLNTEPPGATVVIAGAGAEAQAEIDRQLAGQVTPVEVILPRNEGRALTVVFQLAGHEEQTEMRLALQSENLHRALRPLPGPEAAERGRRRGEVRLSARTRTPPPTTPPPQGAADEPLAEPTFAKPLRRKSRDEE